jgi:hypothetical protein
MSSIKLRSLSMSEAEEAIAQLWSCFEEYGIPSPKLNATRANNRITIELSEFDEPLWAKVVDTCLSNWRCRKMERARVPSTQKDREWARLLRLKTRAISSGMRMVDMPLGAIARINKKSKRRYL